MRPGAGKRPAVLSLLAQAGMREPERVQSQTEVLVRHLYDRLLHNDAFGEDAATRVMQLAYAIALPGVLVALFLFPAYHGLPPHPEERSYWSQTCDHLFYVTYAFTVMGGAVIFQWEMLFPDALDVSVMAVLPIGLGRLLLGRGLAMAAFLGLVHVGTSGLGSLFLPAVADQRCGFFRHVLAHVTAVSMSALCVAAALIVTQGVLVCLPRGRIRETLRAVTRALSLTTLLTVLFLFPLTAHYLTELVGSTSWVVRWFPPIWFLGIYECVMWGSRAPETFQALAWRGVMATAVLVTAGGALYTLGYLRRVRQLIEGPGMQRGRTDRGIGVLRAAVHRVLLRTPRVRATAYFTVQTLLRMERLHLYLAMYAGVGVALVLSGLLAFRVDGSTMRLVISADGVRTAVPIVAFWTVASMKTALRSPLGRQGSWVFRAVGGAAGVEELRGGQTLVAGTAVLSTLVAIAIMNAMAAAKGRWGLMMVAQVIAGVGLSLILTELFFTGVRTIPFAATPRASMYDLPLTLVRYFVIFPAFALSMAYAEAWMEMSLQHLLVSTLMLAMTYLAARWLRIWWGCRPATDEEFLLVGLRLRED